MMEEQAEVPLQEVEAGMVLAVDVVDRHGGVLVSAGTEVGEKLLKLLEVRGIEQITVVTEESLSEGERETRRERICGKLERQYEGFEEDPAMQDLRAMFERYHLRGVR